MIAYLSATGNSRHVALRLSERLGDSRLVDLSDYLKGTTTPLLLNKGESLGFVFPVHSWGLPKGFAELLRTLPIEGISPATYCYMVCTCGDDCGLAAGQWRKAVRRDGLKGKAAFSVFMPNTYVIFPGFDVDSDTVRDRKLADSETAIASIAESISNRKEGDFTHHGSFAWLKSKVIYPGFMLTVSDKPFRATDRCIGCGLCAKVCPTANIRLIDGRPQWQGNCLNCLACYHRCPADAIVFGRKTNGKGKYFYP